MTDITYNYNAKEQILDKVSKLEKVDFSRVVLKEAMVGVPHDQYLSIERIAPFKGMKVVKMLIAIYTANMELINSEVVVVYYIIPAPIIIDFYPKQFTPFQSTGFGTEGFTFGLSSSVNTNVNQSNKYTPIYNSENNIKPGSYVWYSKKNAVVKILDYNMESNSYTILYEDRMIDTTDEFLSKLYIKG